MRSSNESFTRSHFRTAIAFLVALAVAAPLFAYSFPLSSTDIRDAYLVGRRNDDVTINFLNTYVQHFHPPGKGVYVTEIGIDTPFLQIVEKSMGTADYTAPAAVQEFQDKRMNFQAHVILFEPIAAADKKSSGAFWRNYKIKLTQGRDHEIRPLSTEGTSLYTSNAGVMGKSAYNSSGARIDLVFAPDKIDATDTIITVDGPNGEHIEATFDLSTLR